MQGAGANQSIGRQTQRIRDEAGECHRHTQCVISTIDHRHTGKGKSKHTGKGKGKHVDVVETEQLQPSGTASTMSAIESGDVDESMNMVKPGAEAWRLIHSRYAQNTTEMISGSFLHDHADKYNQLADESPDELKEQMHTDNQRHELQPVDIRSLKRISEEVS